MAQANLKKLGDDFARAEAEGRKREASDYWRQFAAGLELRLRELEQIVGAIKDRADDAESDSADGQLEANATNRSIASSSLKQSSPGGAGSMVIAGGQRPNIAVAAEGEAISEGKGLFIEGGLAYLSNAADINRPCRGICVRSVDSDGVLLWQDYGMVAAILAQTATVKGRIYTSVTPGLFTDDPDEVGKVFTQDMGQFIADMPSEIGSVNIFLLSLNYTPLNVPLETDPLVVESLEVEGQLSVLGTTVLQGHLQVNDDITFTGVITGDGSGLTTLTAGELVGFIPDASVPDPLPPVSGANLTNLDAADLTGTVPLASISGITNAQIDAAAGIVDTKLATISTAGKVADTALSANVALENITNTFTDSQIILTSGIAAGLYILTTGTNQQAFHQIRGTGSANNYTRWYCPTTAGTTSQTAYYSIISLANGGDWFHSSSSADCATRFYSGGGGFKHNMAIDGRLVLGTSTVSTSGAQLKTPSLNINSGTDIAGHLSNTASLTFNFGGGPIQTNTITVTGAATGDVIALGFPADADLDGGYIFTAYVSAANTVKIVGTDSQGNLGTVSGTFRADVWKH